jgi:hypothetical protein
MGGEDRRGIKAVEVAGRILDHLATAQTSVALRELAAAGGMSPGKVHRYLASFLASGLARQDPNTRQYALGPLAIRLGLAALNSYQPQFSSNLFTAGESALHLQHGCDNLKAIVYSMIGFLDHHLLAIERMTKISFHSLPLDRHAEKVGNALQKHDVILGEFILRAAVDFEHTIR